MWQSSLARGRGKRAIEKGGRLAVRQERATRGELQGAGCRVGRVRVPSRANLRKRLHALPLLVPALLLALLLGALARLARLLAGQGRRQPPAEGNATQPSHHGTTCAFPVASH